MKKRKNESEKEREAVILNDNDRIRDIRRLDANESAAARVRIMTMMI